MRNTTAARSLLFLALAGLFSILLLNFYESDANFTTYRFAVNLVSGRGLRFLTPSADVTTFPLTPILLAPFAGFTDISFVGWIIATLSITVGALYLTRLLDGHVAAGLAYILAACIAPSPVVMFMLALALASLDFGRLKRWSLAGILIGFAILAEPSAIVLAALMIAIAARDDWRSVWRFVAPAVLLPIVPLLLLIAGFGPAASITPGVWNVILPAFAVIVLAVRRGVEITPQGGLLIVWSALAGMVALIGKTTPSAVVLPGAIAAALWIGQPPRGRLIAVLVIVCAFADTLLRLGLTNQQMAINLDDPRSPMTVGQYLAEKTDTITTVATREIGVLAYFAVPRPIIDMSGKLQNNPVDRFFIFRHAPDAVVIRDEGEIPWSNFKTTYANTFSDGELKLYQRVVNFTPLIDHPQDINITEKMGRNDLVLRGAAYSDHARPGDLLRIRLDWETAFNSQFDFEVKLDLLRADNTSLAGQLDKFSNTEWRVGRSSTYHLIGLPGDAAEGRYALYLNMRVRAGQYGLRRIGFVDISK